MSGLRKPRNRGPKGPIGLTGVAGPAGSTSVSSATPIWFDGQDADDVFPIPGPAGPIGAAGANGAPGAAGANGVNGLAGVMGMPGLDGIDGEDAIAPLGWPAFGVTTVTSAVTGALNDYNPGLGKFTVEHWSGAADAAFTGLRGGAAGHVYFFKNTGTHIGTFTHQSGASTAGNKFAHPVTSAPLPVAQGGSIGYAHDGASWQLIAHQQGVAIAPAFSAAVFSGSGAMTWTVDPGDVQGFTYSIDGLKGIITVFCAVTATSVGGVLDTQLRVAIPGGFTSAIPQVNTGGRVFDSTADTVGLVFVSGGASSLILVMKFPSLAAYQAAVNVTTVQFTMVCQVN